MSERKPRPKGGSACCRARWSCRGLHQGCCRNGAVRPWQPASPRHISVVSRGTASARSASHIGRTQSLGATTMRSIDTRRLAATVALAMLIGAMAGYWATGPSTASTTTGIRIQPLRRRRLHEPHLAVASRHAPGAVGAKAQAAQFSPQPATRRLRAFCVRGHWTCPALDEGAAGKTRETHGLPHHVIGSSGGDDRDDRLTGARTTAPRCPRRR